MGFGSRHRADDDGRKIVSDIEVRSYVKDTLDHIIHLFDGGSKFQRKYGLKNEHRSTGLMLMVNSVTVLALDSLATSLPREGSSTFSLSAALSSLRTQFRKIQKEDSLRGKAKWAIVDRDKFTDLGAHLRDLIEDLEKVTGWPHILQRQRQHLSSEMNSGYALEELRSLERARIGRVDPVSDAASIRLTHMRSDELSQLSSSDKKPDDA
ncbi:hypothetical protein SUNI508_09993 [Seiridium unicorne]|uniref:Prion-inhibition and propagation HeLo domain-containing protein n=1 Tax=Seiridium unicorne TaxID=138068 RepID=A0ABR2UMJ9_9PEZI